MGTPEEQRRSSWPSRLAEAHKAHIQGHIRPLRRDAEAHHRRILEAARRLFAEQGVENVSMRQIALAAGVGQGTLYRRYAHKGDLCMDLLQDRHERFMDEVWETLAANTGAPALTQLDRALTHMVALLEEGGSLLGAIATAQLRDQHCDESADLNERHRGLRDAPWYRLPHEVFVGLLTQAVERGEAAPLDAEYTADTILAALNPMFYHFQRSELGFSQERILQGLRRLFITGLQTP